ncbi:hypothetical protein [Thermodesulfatator atlanticus]|uniref:hypothetical protein n=1 Tax=Thermodesulfatator atlanticus TaxID=501497 RepID=UPI000524660D|nr:hypothetical protein [Thermodesulfatator atlanticus]
MSKLIFKTIILWILIAIFAVLNGILREKLFVSLMGIKIALPLSGLTLSSIIATIVWFFLPKMGLSRRIDFILVGVLLVFFTLIFEFLFGYFVIGKNFSELLEVFDIKNGNLFLLVLLVIGFSPWVCAKIKYGDL